ncbi:MAG: murein biosynthesis integral membrane protein MurJ [Candidatus Riflebacteria bacterium]|nr:murein biosynthesis integral membrane protein MurJ [Candidatus Riflebacteria bacterium]
MEYFQVSDNQSQISQTANPPNSSASSGQADEAGSSTKRVSVARPATIMGIATFLSRIAGLIREQAFAFFFGAGVWTDAFNVAFRIPNLLRDLFAEGAMSAAFVPTFNAVLKNEGKEQAFRLLRLVLTALLICVGLLTITGIIFAPELVSLLAPKFLENPEKFAATVLMTRIMFPFLLVIAWAAAVMGTLNSLSEFFVPAIAPVFLNLAMIAAGFSLCPLASKFGYPAVVGMAVGAMAGGFLQLVVQFPALRRTGFRFGLTFDRRDPGLRSIMKLIVPGTIGLAATQINVAISTILSTTQGDGAVSWLSYAFRLMQLPLGIFGVAVAQATLPVISRQAASQDHSGMRSTLAESLKLTGFINIAATAALVALAEPIIRLLFEHGRFTPADTAATVLALRAYAVGLFFFSAIKVLGPAFYALKDARTPLLASVLSVAVNIFLNLALIRPFGYWGLAFGSSIAAGVNAGVLWWKIGKKLGSFSDYRVATSLGKILLAAVLSALSMHTLFPTLHLYASSHFSGRWAGAASDISGMIGAPLLGLPILFLAASILGIPEARRARDMIARRFGKTEGKNEKR